MTVSIGSTGVFQKKVDDAVRKIERGGILGRPIVKGRQIEYFHRSDVYYALCKEIKRSKTYGEVVRASAAVQFYKRLFNISYKVLR